MFFANLLGCKMLSGSYITFFLINCLIHSEVFIKWVPFEDLEKERLKESCALQRLEHLSEWHSIAFIVGCLKNDSRAVHPAL